MPFDEAMKSELEDILASMGTEAFDSDAKRRLDVLVGESDQARRIYLDHCQMHAMLHQSALLAAFHPDTPQGVVVPSGQMRRPFATWAGLAVAASVLFIVGVAAARFFGGGLGSVESATEPRIACVETLEGSAWIDESKLAQGVNVSGGAIRVESGSMELRFDHGTRLLVQGPAQLSIDSDMQVSLVRGQVAALVTEIAHGFTVLGPDSAVVDLGTEFAMAVQDGNSWVEVYDGEVEVALLNEDGHAWKSRELFASGAVRIDASNGQIVDEDPPIVLPRLPEAFLEPLNVPAAYVEQIKSSGPAHYWRFETADNGHVADIMGQAVAVLEGGVRLRSGGAYFPRGRRNHGFVSIANPKPSLLCDEFTLEAWVNPSLTQRSTVIDINHREPVSRLREKLYRLSLTPAVHQQVYPGESFRFAGQLWPYGEKEDVCVFSASQYEAGTWNHVVAVRRQDQLEIYLNGSSVEIAPALPLTADPLDATIAIGAFLRSQASSSHSGQMFFKGMIDELTVYPRALSAEDVAEHYRLMQAE